MKATFEYKLPEEQEEYADHLRGPTFKQVLWDLDNWMRSQLKHVLPSDDHKYDGIDAARDELYRILQEHEVSIHD